MFRSLLRVPIHRSSAPFLRTLCEAAPSSSSSSSSSSSGAFEFVQVRSDDRIGYVEIHRPRDMNKLNSQTMDEIAEAMESHDSDPSVSVIIVHGSDRVFAAGSDVSELASRSFQSVRYRRDPWQAFDKLSLIRKPILAAVSGFALGMGCELAMTADIVIASKDATFGQPEIQLGMLPGAGGTQRLVHAVGKPKAMEMILTGRHMTADEAESVGLVSRVTEKGQALEEAKEVALIIARHSQPVVTAAKECVNVAFESTLSEGLRFERRAAQTAFSLEDSKEGLKAFLDERKPSYKNR